MNRPPLRQYTRKHKPTTGDITLHWHTTTPAVKTENQLTKLQAPSISAANQAAFCCCGICGRIFYNLDQLSVHFNKDHAYEAALPLLPANNAIPTPLPEDREQKLPFRSRTANVAKQSPSPVPRMEEDMHSKSTVKAEPLDLSMRRRLARSNTADVENMPAVSTKQEMPQIEESPCMVVVHYNGDTYTVDTCNNTDDNNNERPNESGPIELFTKPAELTQKKDNSSVNTPLVRVTPIEELSNNAGLQNGLIREMPDPDAVGMNSNMDDWEVIAVAITNGPDNVETVNYVMLQVDGEREQSLPGRSLYWHDDSEQVAEKSMRMSAEYQEGETIDDLLGNIVVAGGCASMPLTVGANEEHESVPWTDEPSENCNMPAAGGGADLNVVVGDNAGVAKIDVVEPEISNEVFDDELKYLPKTVPSNKNNERVGENNSCRPIGGNLTENQLKQSSIETELLEAVEERMHPAKGYARTTERSNRSVFNKPIVASASKMNSSDQIEDLVKHDDHSNIRTHTKKGKTVSPTSKRRFCAQRMVVQPKALRPNRRSQRLGAKCVSPTAPVKPVRRKPKKPANQKQPASGKNRSAAARLARNAKSTTDGTRLYRIAKSAEFPCPHCGRHLTSEYKRDRHIRYRHELERTYKCHICEHSFPWMNDLRRHLLFHLDVRPFACPHCPHTSKTAYNLRIHLRRHTEQAAGGGLGGHYRCEKCQRTFAKSGDLRRHLCNKRLLRVIAQQQEAAA